MLDRSARNVCTCLAMWFAAASASAQSGPTAEDHDLPPAGPPIALNEALARTMARNPALVAFGYRIESAEGRLQQAGIGPNPELAITVNDAVGSGDFRAVRNAETTVSIAWVIERGMGSAGGHGSGHRLPARAGHPQDAGRARACSALRAISTA